MVLGVNIEMWEITSGTILEPLLGKLSRKKPKLSSSCLWYPFTTLIPFCPWMRPDNRPFCVRRIGVFSFSALGSANEHNSLSNRALKFCRACRRFTWRNVLACRLDVMLCYRMLTFGRERHQNALFCLRDYLYSSATRIPFMRVAVTKVPRWPVEKLVRPIRRTVRTYKQRWRYRWRKLVIF